MPAAHATPSRASAPQEPTRQQPSLWGRLWRRPPTTARDRARQMGQQRQPVAPPVVRLPTHRPLTTRDVLWRLDSQTGRRIYVPLVVEGAEGHWAGREWHHCGAEDGVLLVAWAERDHALAVQHPCALAGGRVRVVEGGA